MAHGMCSFFIGHVVFYKYFNDQMALLMIDIAIRQNLVHGR